MTGIYLHTIGDQLVAVATNGIRLLRVGVNAPAFNDDSRLIVPASAAATLRRLLRLAKVDDVTLRRSGNLLSVAATGSFELITGLIDASFPDYTRVMPRSAGNTATCQRAELLGALARLRTIGDLVRLAWEEGDDELLLSLPRMPLASVDTLAAKTAGSASMTFDIAQLELVISEFADRAINLDVTDRTLLIEQGAKTGVLTCCNVAEEKAAA